MSWTDHFMHSIGVLSLCVFAGAGALAARSLVTSIRPQWRRILRLAAGHIEHAAPVASGTLSLVPTSPRPRAAEAGAGPAGMVR